MQVGCRLCERNSFLAPRSRYVSGLASPQPPLIHLSDWAAWRVSEILIQRSRGDNLSAPIGKDQLVHSQSCADVSDGNLKSSVSGLLKNGPKHQTHTQKLTFNAGNHSPKSRKPSAKRQTTRRIQENKRVLQKKPCWTNPEHGGETQDESMIGCGGQTDQPKKVEGATGLKTQAVIN